MHKMIRLQLFEIAFVLFLVRNMALSRSGGVASFGSNDLRFLDQLDLVHEYKIQSAAFSVPITHIGKELPKIGVRPPQWYETFCCAQPGQGQVLRKRNRKPRVRQKKPTLAPLPIIKLTATKPVEPKIALAAPSDDCLLPLTPVPNPMPFLRFIHVPQEPPILPSGIRAIRIIGNPLWATNELPIWNRPVVQRPQPFAQPSVLPPWTSSKPQPFAQPSIQPPWTSSKPQQRPQPFAQPSVQPPWTNPKPQPWNKSETLQPGWARSLVRLGRMLQDVGERRTGEAEAMVAEKGDAFGKQLERKCSCLAHLMSECIQLLENQGNRKRNLEDNA